MSFSDATKPSHAGAISLWSNEGDLRRKLFRLVLASLFLVAQTIPGETIRSEFALRGSWPGPDMKPFDVKAAGRYAYLAMGSAGLVVLDVSNPSSPFRVGGLDTDGVAHCIELTANYAFIAAFDAGVQIVDISDPTTPILVGAFDTSGYAETILLGGNLAFIADGTSGLEIFDVSEPRTPTRVGGVKTAHGQTTGYAVGVQVIGNYAYVADRNTGLNVVDVRDLANPVIVSQFGCCVEDVAVSGNYAFEDDRVVDISDRANPKQIALLPSDSGHIQRVGNYLYTATARGDFRIIDVSVPASPTLVAVFDPGPSSNDFLSRVHVIDGLAYVAGGSAASVLTILDVRNPATPTLLGTYSLAGDIFDVQVVGNLAYCASRGSGLLVLDISNRSKPTLIGSAVTNNLAEGLCVLEGTAYVANENGLVCLDVSNPSHPVQVGVARTADFARHVRVQGTFAYVAGGRAGLEIIDVADRSRPVRIGVLDTGSAYDVDVLSNLVFVADVESGFNIVSVVDPIRPTLVAKYPPTETGNFLFRDARGVRVIGTNVYVHGYGGVLVVFDITNPAVPKIRAANYVREDSAQGVEVVNNRIYVSKYGDGFHVLDFEKGTNLVVTGFSSTPAISIRVVDSNVFAASVGGLNVLQESRVDYYLLTRTAQGDGGITVSPLPGPYGYRSGDVVRVVAAPAPGWTLLGWFGDISGSLVTNQVVMTRDRCAEAIFGTPLSTTIAGEGSIHIDPKVQLYPQGSTVNLTAVPGPGNYFSNWGNEITGTTNPARLTILRGNPTLFAQFAPLPAGQHSLSAVSIGGGFVRLTPPGNKFTNGQVVTLTAIPDPDQEFLGWSDDVNGTQNPQTIIMDQSKVITATFTTKSLFHIGACATTPTEGGFRLLMSGQLGVPYMVETSSNLMAWAPIVTLTNVAGVMQFNDGEAMRLNHRFYRAVQFR